MVIIYKKICILHQVIHSDLARQFFQCDGARILVRPVTWASNLYFELTFIYTLS